MIDCCQEFPLPLLAELVLPFLGDIDKVGETQRLDLLHHSDIGKGEAPHVDGEVVLLEGEGVESERVSQVEFSTLDHRHAVGQVQDII